MLILQIKKREGEKELREDKPPKKNVAGLESMLLRLPYLNSNANFFSSFIISKGALFPIVLHYNSHLLNHVP